MIVHHDDGACSDLDRFFKHLPWVHEAGRGRAFGDFNTFNQSIFTIEAECPEIFDVFAGDECAEVAGDDAGRVEDRFHRVVFSQYTAGKVHDGHELQRFDGADAFDGSKVGSAPT